LCLPTLFSKLTPSSSNHCDELYCVNHCNNCDVYLPHYDIDHCDYHSHCDTSISHCGTPSSHCDTSMASLPPEYCSLGQFPPPGLENCLPSARAPGSLPLSPTLVHDYPLCTQTLPPIASQPDRSNPPPPAPTNPTFSPPSPNHTNSLRILQWNSGGLSSCRTLFLSFLHSVRSGASLRD